MFRSFGEKLSFLRHFSIRQVSTKEAAALLPFADGKAMDCRRQFRNGVSRVFVRRFVNLEMAYHLCSLVGACFFPRRVAIVSLRVCKKSFSDSEFRIQFSERPP